MLEKALRAVLSLPRAMVGNTCGQKYKRKKHILRQRGRGTGRGQGRMAEVSVCFSEAGRWAASGEWG